MVTTESLAMPTSAHALNQEAALLTRQGKLEEAKSRLRQALQYEPENAESHAHLGNVFVYQELYDDAIAQYREALRLKPDFFMAHYILAIALHDKGQLSEAETHYRQALRLQPNNAEAHHSLGITLMEQGRLDEALVSYQHALRLNPNFADVYNNVGNVLVDQKKLDQAIHNYRSALRINPGRAQVHFNLGIALERQGDLDAAILSYRQALRLNPNYVEVEVNLGNTLAAQGKPEEAIRCYEQILKVKPKDAEAFTNIGNVHRDLGRFAEALACFERAVLCDATRAGPHHNRALLWLLMGQWSVGWPEYEWRWQTTDFRRHDFRQPRWDGSPLGGRTLVVVAEQGLGDTIQFIRYIPLLQPFGGRVIFQCQAPLQRLLVGCAGLADVTIQGAPLPPFDFYIPLLSLPGVLGTNPTNVPAVVPYFNADPQLEEHWRRELEPLKGFKIGIAWQGSLEYRYDRQRSISLVHFARLAARRDIHLISLQKGPGSEQLTSYLTGLAPPEKSKWLDLATKLDEVSGAFMDTAAVMKSLDLVISSDTAIAHLAGALAVPVWVALPLIPDWRWLLEREDSPWYPTMRLFRQTRSGNWNDVFDRIAAELNRV
jgi:tetratricopeptide (TPR) repeat protein